MTQKQSTVLAFCLITSLFFLWGFAHNLDPILIPHLKKSFTLSTTQATLVDTAVFAAYFVMAIPAGMLMKRAGYKAGIITGLVCFAIGCFLFVPAANLQSYDFFLIALFVIACGLTILETAANPYATILGNPDTAAQRLNLAQSFNGLAAALAPAIGARIILTKGYSEAELANMSDTAKQVALASEAASVKAPYITLGIVLLLVSLVFARIRLPVIKQEGQPQHKRGNIFQALRHRHLAWGAIAQFFYVGAQVSVFSLFLLYAGEAAGMAEVTAADYLSACGIAFLIGRFVGTGLMQKIKPSVLLTVYALISLLLCFVAIGGKGMITIYAVIGICFFMSIMFPTIFALGIKDLGTDTEYGSSLIIMSIVGGAILPRCFGYISDVTGNIQLGYWVPLVCFAVIAWFGFRGHRVKAA